MFGSVLLPALDLSGTLGVSGSNFFFFLGSRVRGFAGRVLCYCFVLYYGVTSCMHSIAYHSLSSSSPPSPPIITIIHRRFSIIIIIYHIIISESPSPEGVQKRGPASVYAVTFRIPNANAKFPPSCPSFSSLRLSSLRDDPLSYRSHPKLPISTTVFRGGWLVYFTINFICILVVGGRKRVINNNQKREEVTLIFDVYDMTVPRRRHRATIRTYCTYR